MKFRKIAKFYYKDEQYQMFYDIKGRAAYLVIGNDGKYHYPELEKVLEINYYLHKDNDGIMEMKNDNITKFNFLPKVKYAGGIILLTTAILTGCGRSNSTYTLPSTTTESTTSNITTNEDTTTNEKTAEEIEDEYLSLLAPADDDTDFRYASDFENYEFLNTYTVRDANGYKTIFGYDHVTIDDIKNALAENNNISQEYKDFIIQYVEDWLSIWPDTDFSNFCNNLKTLKINELTEQEMALEAMSMSTAAQYLKNENTINVLKGITLDRGSDDYIVLAHELTHCARNARYEEKDGRKIRVYYYEDHKMGLYADEAIDTNLVYELQGLDNKSVHYTLQSSYYRIIMDCTGYDGNDYMNHSVNYLIDKMDEYMGDEQYAYHIVALIDAQASLHYTDYLEVDYTEFTELYQYITKMYCKKYLSANMSYDEAQEVYNNLIEELTYNFENMKNPYELNYDVLEEQFNECCQDLGIENSLTR